MKILPTGAELFRADRRTDRHDKAKSFFAVLITRQKAGRGKKIAVCSKISADLVNAVCEQNVEFFSV